MQEMLEATQGQNFVLAGSRALLLERGCQQTSKPSLPACLQTLALMPG